MKDGRTSGDVIMPPLFQESRGRDTTSLHRPECSTATRHVELFLNWKNTLTLISISTMLPSPPAHTDCKVFNKVLLLPKHIQEI